MKSVAVFTAGGIAGVTAGILIGAALVTRMFGDEIEEGIPDKIEALKERIESDWFRFEGWIYGEEAVRKFAHTVSRYPASNAFIKK